MKNIRSVSWLSGLLVFSFIGRGLKASESPYTGNVNVLFGDKYMSSADWAPVENQEEFGLEIDFAKTEWPLFATIAYSQTSDYEIGFFNDTKAKTQSLDIGVKKIWTAIGAFRPFLGSGLTYVRGELNMIDNIMGGTVSNDGNGVGYWASGGFGYLIAERYNIGARLKWSSARLKFDNGDGSNVDVLGGGLHVGIFTGVHF